MALESVFITAAIDTKEHLKVVTIDISGAFLHANNEDYSIMKMVGTLAELMVKTNPKLYKKYVVIKKGCSVLYLRLQKASNGMIKAHYSSTENWLLSYAIWVLKSTHTIPALRTRW